MTPFPFPSLHFYENNLFFNFFELFFMNFYFFANKNNAGNKTCRKDNIHNEQKSFIESSALLVGKSF